MNFFEHPDFKRLIKNNLESKSYLLKLLNRMEEGLSGRLSEHFHILPLDTGFGKSTLIKIFLAVWKAEGFKGGGSILIALATKKEIEDFTDSCSLDDGDYAAYTSDSLLNARGAGVNMANHVPILFTTHAMLRGRTRKKNFKQAHEFFYKGNPRPLRLWDERCLRAEPIHLCRDDLLTMLAPIRPYFPEWAEGVEEFAAIIKRVPVGTILNVPIRFGEGKQYSHVEGVPPIVSSHVLNVHRQLKASAGRSLRVCAGKKYGNTLIGSGVALPNDLAPMLVLDASARIGDGYQHWGRTAPVIVSPPLVRQYGNLTVRIWKTASGQSVLADGDKRARLLAGIAKTLNLDPQPTLLIGSKARAGLYDLRDELADRLDNPDDLSFRHWGVHYGTNEFAECKRLVVVGSYRNRDTVDQAIYMAGSGIDPASVTGDEWIETRRAEMKQNLLQAFSRGNLRNGTNGECGECIVYFIAPATDSPEVLVIETFPGCRIEEWQPYGTVLTKQAKLVFDVLQRMVEQGRVGDVPKREVRMAAPVASASRFSQILAKPEFANALRILGVTWTKSNFVIQRQQNNVISIADARKGFLAKQEATKLAA